MFGLVDIFMVFLLGAEIGRFAGLVSAEARRATQTLSAAPGQPRGAAFAKDDLIASPGWGGAPPAARAEPGNRVGVTS